MKATAALIHDTRREKAFGRYPVKLRITYNRKQKYFPLDVDLTKSAFLDLQNPKVKGELKEVKLKLMGQLLLLSGL